MPKRPENDDGAIAGNIARIPPGPDEQTPAAPAPITLPARRDWSLVARALEDRRDTLTSLAKKASEAGYANEAAHIQIDADAIKERLLPAVREQREFAFTSKDALEHVTTLVHEYVARALGQTPRPKISDVEPDLAADVLAFGERCYRAGYDVGHTARQDNLAGQIARAADAARQASREAKEAKSHG